MSSVYPPNALGNGTASKPIEERGATSDAAKTKSNNSRWGGALLALVSD
jgi:hypothetical protein